MDCDKKVLKSCTELAPGDYTRTMLHLLEMSAGTGKNTGGRIEALGFLMAKQRFAAILAYPKHIWRIITLAILGGLAAAAVLLSMSASRTYFYPYPETIAFYILEYRKEYDRESLTGTKYEYLLEEDTKLYAE